MGERGAPNRGGGSLERGGKSSIKGVREGGSVALFEKKSQNKPATAPGSTPHGCVPKIKKKGRTRREVYFFL